MTKFNLFFGLAFSLALFSSCKKETEAPQTPEATQQDCRLSKVLDGNNNPLIEITYNSDKQAVTYLDHTYSDLYTYTYAGGNLATASHSHTKPNPGDFNQTYTINAVGLVTRQDFISPTSSNYHLFWLFDYDTEKRLSRTQLYHIGLNGQPDDFREKRWYLYNTDGNREKSLITNNLASAQDTAGYGYIYEYDKMPNPYYPLRNLPSVMSWSKNNPTKSIRTYYDSYGALLSQTLEGNYQNEYNKDGLLVKSTYIPTNGNSNVVRKFEYICN
jgi:hypothetical protein